MGNENRSIALNTIGYCVLMNTSNKYIYYRYIVEINCLVALSK